MKTGYLVADIMTERPITMRPTDSVVDCAKTMKKEHVGAIVVKDDSRMAGIITEQDIVRNAIAEGKNPLNLTLSDIMVKEVRTIEPEKDIFDAITKMRNANIRHLPVVSEGKFLGLLTLKDILRIEPQLFEMLVDRIELRESERKPIPPREGRSGICNTCGEYADELFRKDGVLMCEKCRAEH